MSTQTDIRCKVPPGPQPRAAAIGLAALLLAGCATSSLTGRSQLMLVSEQSAVSGSASAYSSMISGLGKKGKLDTDSPRAVRVREITERLIAQAVRFRPDAASWNWQLSVIDEPKTVNAFCMAGGKMGIYTGFWKKLNATDDEIANVMGHEIGHALASHTRERMSVAMATGVGAALLSVIVTPRTPGDPGAARNQDVLATAAALAVTLPNSRESESEADQIGIELAARAGYDPRAAVSLWQKMAKAGGQPPEFLSTHPSPDSRIRQLDLLVAKVDSYYQTARKTHPSGDAPAFLDPGMNERKVGAGGTPSRQAYAARVASQAETLSFVTESFEKFKRGDMLFDCRSGCAIAYALNRGEWKKLHAAGAWRELAVSVAKVAYYNDLSYFLLAEAAQALGAPAAARTYYERARDAAKAGFSCAGVPDTCEGFEVARIAAAQR